MSEPTFCLHPDATVSVIPGGMKRSCPDCPAYAAAMTGYALPEIGPWMLAPDARNAPQPEG